MNITSLSKKSYFNSLYLQRLIYTPLNRFKAIIYGIKLGTGCNFWGNTIFVKKNLSVIKIGNRCKFKSKSTSNLIGINRPCIMATHLPGAIIEIGNNCGFSGTVIGAFKSILIGSNVRCGANTLITDSDWHLDDPRAGTPKEVIIEDNVWLGEGTKVLKGVTFGKNSVIGAGSVVTKRIPTNVIAAGNPCRVVKSLEIEK